MKCLDMKIANPTKEGKAFWRTIGTVFLGDDSEVTGQDGKPITFVIDYPRANGIIVPRERREDAT